MKNPFGLLPPGTPESGGIGKKKKERLKKKGHLKMIDGPNDPSQSGPPN